LWRSPLCRWLMSHDIPIVTNTNENPAKAKPSTYQSGLVNQNLSHYPGGIRGHGRLRMTHCPAF